jgi:hypothetical protein
MDLLACGCAWSSRGIEWDDIVRVFGDVPLMLCALVLDAFRLLAPVFVVSAAPLVVWGVVAVLRARKKPTPTPRRRVVVRSRR